MIPGVVASQAAADEDFTGLPEPLADIQFDTGVATIGDVAVDMEDIIDRPENLVPGQGLVLSEDFSCEILGDLKALLITGDWTVAMAWYRPSSFATPLEVSDGNDTVIGYSVMRVEDTNGYFLTFDTYIDPASHERDLVGEALSGPVSRSIAWRRTDAEISMSLDIGDVVSDSTPVTMPPLSKAWIGGYSVASYGLIVLQRLTIYASAEATDDVLPQLNTPEPLGVAASDTFANAILIEVGQALYIFNTGASKEVGEPNHGGEAGGASVWFEFVAPANESYTVDLNAWTQVSEPIVAVYTGSAVGSLTPVVSDVDDAWLVTFSATMGTSYKIALDGVDGEEGFFSIKVASAATAGGDDELLLLLL